MFTRGVSRCRPLAEQPRKQREGANAIGDELQLANEAAARNVPLRSAVAGLVVIEGLVHEKKSVVGVP